MKKLSEMNQQKVGVVGLVGVVLLLALAVNVSNLRTLFVGTTYTADFVASGGLNKGDDVRVAGLGVGKVASVKLVEKHVEVTFTLEGIKLGDRSRAAVKSANALGSKYLAIQPGGAGNVQHLPQDRTDAPYDVTDALGDLTRNTEELDVDQLAKSFDALAGTFSDTAPALRDALTGVNALAKSLNERDSDLRLLLSRAADVSTVLADRSANITRILANASQLLSELEARRLVIRSLLVNARTAANQLAGLADDNKATLQPTLKQLRTVVKVLDENEKNLNYVLDNLGRYERSLGEAVGGGPFFYAYLQNLVPPSNLATGILPGVINTGGN